MNSDRNANTKRVRNLMMFVILVIFGEYLIRNMMFVKSLYLIEWMQLNMQFMIPLEQALSLFGIDKMFVVIVLIAYNFFNIYKTFILITVITVGSYISGFLKMIYTGPRPYWIDVNIVAYWCEAGWGNPSGHALCATAFYLTLWKLSFPSDSESHKIILLKKISLIITIIFIVLICLSRLLLGVHGLNQILYGALIGFFIYYYLFSILKPNPDNPEELLEIITMDPYFLLIVNGLLLAGSLIGYFTFSQLNPNKEIYNRIIDQNNCAYLQNCKRFENEALINCIAIHLIWVSMYAIKFEYDRFFSNNLQNWVIYNFEHFFNKEHQVRLLTYEEINHDNRQWNNTNFATSLLRMIVIFFLLIVLFLFYFIISCNSNMLLVVIFKILIPSSAALFLFFTYFKKFFSYLKLAN